VQLWMLLSMAVTARCCWCCCRWRIAAGAYLNKWWPDLAAFALQQRHCTEKIVHRGVLWAESEGGSRITRLGKPGNVLRPN